MRKLPEGKSGDPGPSNMEMYSAWPYFQSMLFLKDQVKPRKAGGNLSFDIETNMANDNEVEEIQEVIDIIAEDPIVEITDTCTADGIGEGSLKPNMRVGKRRAHDQLIEIERRKLKLLEKREKTTGEDGYDEDEAFFRSLLPHVRKIKSEDKLNFRMKVQSVVQHFVYDKRKNVAAWNDRQETSVTFQGSPYPRTSTRETGMLLRDYDSVPPVTGSSYLRSPIMLPEEESDGSIEELQRVSTVESARRPTIISSTRQHSQF